MKKKVIGIFLCVCMVAAMALSACGGKADDALKEYAGRYDLVGVESEGYKVQADAVIEGECYMNLTDDGKGEVTFDSDSDKIKSWSVDGTTIELKIEGSDEESGTI